ncbi:MAG: hypothetical protein HPY44_04135 [Armatimonadetes bacterium]|nr:hypothetical protein [Armatimonadota bacterium]
MLIFVDYDNIPVSVRRLGLKHIVSMMMNRIGVPPAGPHERVDCRLYGGWYQEDSPTQLCQELAAEILGDFPRAVTVYGEATDEDVVVRLELAYGLLADPDHHLLRTYRLKGSPGNIKCRDPRDAGCLDADCPLQVLYDCVVSGRCPKCGLPVDSVLYRAEQKLVDTMMTADIIHAVTRGETVVGVASSDADLWPAMRTAIRLGTEVVHIQTRRSPASDDYHEGLGELYSTVHIEGS